MGRREPPGGKASNEWTFESQLPSQRLWSHVSRYPGIRPMAGEIKNRRACTRPNLADKDMAAVTWFLFSIAAGWRVRRLVKMC